jgi:uncharacterized repeat protein (TIGR03803 family)
MARITWIFFPLSTASAVKTIASLRLRPSPAVLLLHQLSTEIRPKPKTFEGFVSPKSHDWMKGHCVMKKSSMKTSITNLLLLPALIAALSLMPAGRVTAQTLTTLHVFTAGSGGFPNNITNSDGAYPAGLIVSGATLYGTASQGGTSGNGAVFRVNTDGTGFTNLHSFSATSTNSSGFYTNSDGAQPSGLILRGNTLYGRTQGGTNGSGTVFAINTDGAGFTNLYCFSATTGPSNTNSDGAWPSGLVILSNRLYGAASFGGRSGNGTIFTVNTDGTGLTTLYSFTARDPNAGTNVDGAYPSGMLISSNRLFGTASAGGGLGGGTVFAVTADGTGFTNLHSFVSTAPGVGNLDAGLVLSGNSLCGTTSDNFGGASPRYVTVFALNTDGSGFTNLFAWRGCQAFISPGNVSGNTVYGTVSGLFQFPGGARPFGSVFALNTDGTGLTTLYEFGGVYELGGLTVSGNTLYGTTPYPYGTAPGGGSSDNGTVYGLSFQPQLTITPAGGNVILTWPTNYAGFDYTGYTLQSTTNLVAPAVWATNSPAPVVVAGQNTVTNPISGAQRFYRLIQ